MRPGERSANLVLALVTVILALAIGIVIPLASGGGVRREDIAWTPPPTAPATSMTPQGTLTAAALPATAAPPTATPTSLRPTTTATPTATTAPTATIAPTATTALTATPAATATTTPAPTTTVPAAATPAPPQTPTEQQPVATPAAALTVKIVAEPVNLRVGPGTSFAPLGIARLGEVYALRGRNADGSWYQVCCVRNAPAWVKAEFVEPDAAVDTLPVVP